MDNEKTIYRCFFKFRDYRYPFVDGYQGPSMFATGFWINEDMEFTNGDDAKYFIPISQILYIEKINT